MIFVDTGAWIALTDRSDQYHAAATAIYASLRSRREGLLTSDYIIDETVTRLRYDAGHEAALRFLGAIERLEQTEALRRVSVTAEVFQEAVSIFRRYSTATLSFTDCTSFALCRQYGVAEAFAFDRHFEMMGFMLSTA